MATAVDVANAALARLSARQITALTDPTPEARACNRLFNFARDAVLHAHDWRFATGYAPLTSVLNPAIVAPATTPAHPAPSPWLYAYPRPSDCIRPRFMVPGSTSCGWDLTDQQMPFDEAVVPVPSGNTMVDTPVLLTYSDPVVLAYTRQIADPSMWEPAFVSIFTLQLAAEICLPVTGKPDLARELGAITASAVLALKPDGQNQGTTSVQRRNPMWLEARYGA